MADSDVMDLAEEIVSTETSHVKENGVLENSGASSSKVSQNDPIIEESLPSTSKTSEENASNNEPALETSTSKREIDPEWLDILGSGHLKKKVLVKGEEDSRPRRGETVILDIVGKLENGTEFERHENLEICIGDAEVIQGLDYALPLMDQGESAQIVVKPRFGYGSLGDPPRVPKDATLNYTVTLKDVIEIKDITTIPINDRLSIGLKKKERGNWWYQRKEYNLAIHCYRKALQYFEEELTDCNDEITEAKIKTYNNLSMAHLNIEAYDAALQSVNNVLSHEPDNIKAVYRKVKILKAQGEIEAALTLAKNGLKRKPDSPALQDELNILVELKKKSTSAQKVLYRKMFKNNEDKKKDPKSKTVLSITWKWLGLITVAVGIIGAAAIKYKY